MMAERLADVVIIGGSTGGCAAALAACRLGRTVILTEETPWIGGQFTSQTVPGDEHRFIEHFGSSESYRSFRRGLRSYYKHNFPLTADARATRWFNPGNHECSSLASEPRAALAVFHSLLAQYVHSGRLIILPGSQPIAAETEGDYVRSVRVR
jgi:choline dehydrogenase-like flavoprotein